MDHINHIYGRYKPYIWTVNTVHMDRIHRTFVLCNRIHRVYGPYSPYVRTSQPYIRTSQGRHGPYTTYIRTLQPYILASAISRHPLSRVPCREAIQGWQKRETSFLRRRRDTLTFFYFFSFCVSGVKEMAVKCDAYPNTAFSVISCIQKLFLYRIFPQKRVSEDFLPFLLTMKPQ
jgi:hypothetical protein